MNTAKLASRDSFCIRLLTASIRFIDWLEHVGYDSFDPYDIWGTRYGIWSRKVYYSNSLLGAPLITPLILMEMARPSLRANFVDKSRFATADAQLLMAFINLYNITGEHQYLDRASTLGEELLSYSILGYKGPCWGYPFDWQINKNELWKRNTPFITCTPYCYEAFLNLGTTTGHAKHIEIARKIADFVHDDLKDIPTGPHSAAGSYSPYDSRRVVNASAYRAYVLFDAGTRFGRDDHLNTALKNLNFVIDSQQEDGSWYYAMENKQSFIDNFHTCFNLKNLFKLNRIVRSDKVKDSIKKGYDYYLRNLIDKEGNPISFALQPRLQTIKLDMYNFAEGITLGSMLCDHIPEAMSLARDLADKLITRYQLPAGHFVTRVYCGGIHHRFPFLRWPQAQLFYSLTNIIAKILEADKIDDTTSRQNLGEIPFCGLPQLLESLHYSN